MIPSDFRTGAWLRLVEHMQERIDELRRSNDSDLSEKQTADVRGRIAELKRFLALPSESPAVPPEGSDA